MGPQGRFMDAQNYKSVCAKVFDFCKILKMCKKILSMNSGFKLFKNENAYRKSHN